MSKSLGKVHSFQSLGAVDGPGVRFVVFLQGCNLRCGCCHNPDTWEINSGEVYSAEDIAKRVLRYKEYFGNDGGITISGGEPLLQPEFVKEIFDLCHQNGINTCIDTSGSILNDNIKSMLSVTDRVLLDIKYANDEQYQKYVGCSIKKPLKFLDYLQEANIPTTLRQVIIPTLNDNYESVLQLKRIAEMHNCVDGIELLPFKKFCQVKYDEMNIKFPFASFREPNKDEITKLESLLK